MSFWASWNFRTMPRQASFRPFSAHHQVRYFTVTGVWAVARRGRVRVSAAPLAPATVARNGRRVEAAGMGVTSVSMRVACIASAFVPTMMAISRRESSRPRRGRHDAASIEADIHGYRHGYRLRDRASARARELVTTLTDDAYVS